MADSTVDLELLDSIGNTAAESVSVPATTSVATVLSRPTSPPPAERPSTAMVDVDDENPYATHPPPSEKKEAPAPASPAHRPQVTTAAPPKKSASLLAPPASPALKPAAAVAPASPAPKPAAAAAAPSPARKPIVAAAAAPASPAPKPAAAAPPIVAAAAAPASPAPKPAAAAAVKVPTTPAVSTPVKVVPGAPVKLDSTVSVHPEQMTSVRRKIDMSEAAPPTETKVNKAEEKARFMAEQKAKKVALLEAQSKASAAAAAVPAAAAAPVPLPAKAAVPSPVKSKAEARLNAEQFVNELDSAFATPTTTTTTGTAKKRRKAKSVNYNPGGKKRAKVDPASVAHAAASAASALSGTGTDDDDGDDDDTDASEVMAAMAMAQADKAKLAASAAAPAVQTATASFAGPTKEKKKAGRKAGSKNKPKLNPDGTPIASDAKPKAPRKAGGSFEGCVAYLSSMTPPFSAIQTSVLERLTSGAPIGSAMAAIQPVSAYSPNLPLALTQNAELALRQYCVGKEPTFRATLASLATTKFNYQALFNFEPELQAAFFSFCVQLNPKMFNDMLQQTQADHWSWITRMVSDHCLKAALPSATATVPAAVAAEE